MKTIRLHFLFQRYLDQECTPGEEAELMQLLADSSSDEEREKLISDCFDSLPETYALSEADADKVFNQIIDKPLRKIIIPLYKKKGVIRWISLAAAVAVILISVTIVLFRNNKPVNEINQVVEIVKPINKPFYKNDIKPGGNKAILTLADGTKIVLDDASEGAISRQGNTTIIKLDNGRLAYNAQTVSKMPSKAILYNTLTTPRGGQYCVTLADGTIVWLNASTSMRFPTAFAGSERKVEIKGEAYFEVAKNAAMPFIVKAGNEEIKVLGTHFNVTAYADDKVIKTTLLEGRVEVSLIKSSKTKTTGNLVILQPGQQSQLDLNNDLTVVDADLEEAIAWKNGYFVFNNENIESIMLKISRWYDIKVDYQVDPLNRDFTGNISRTENVSEVLNMLEQTDAIHFKIEGKTITVLP
jgi:ferric-dicitrate binding protein FerR (iron transport regulator)